MVVCLIVVMCGAKSGVNGGGGGYVVFALVRMSELVIE